MTGGGVLSSIIHLEWVCTMKLEKFKEKNNKRFIAIFTVCCILLLAGVFLYTSFASFTEEKQFNVINGTYQDPGDIYFAYYVDGEITRDLPKQNTGYIFDVEQSNCTNGVIPSWDYASWTFKGNYSNYNAADYTRTRCNLYFKKTKTVNTVLGDLEVYTYTPDFTKSACDDATCESHEKGIFETTDEDGPTYYYRGSVENNYVYFANKYWRIIRINGNGSIRMIYDGTVAHKNGEVSEDRQAGTSRFHINSDIRDNNMYVGYMYSENEVHGLTTSSLLKQETENFYTNHLILYQSYIDVDATFCGDRSKLDSLTDSGIGKNVTYYQGYLRVLTSNPSLGCEDVKDIYTYTSSSMGNKALTYPIGFITVDEILLAGSSGGYFNGYRDYQKVSPNNYLVTGSAFWTATPAGFYTPLGYQSVSASLIFAVTYNGLIDDAYVTNLLGLRPVINIRSDVNVSGDGTMQNPYKLSGN